MTSRRTKIFPKTGRGLGHVTPTIFGSTVGYPSDSLASCLTTKQRRKILTPSKAALHRDMIPGNDARYGHSYYKIITGTQTT